MRTRGAVDCLKMRLSLNELGWLQRLDHRRKGARPCPCQIHHNNNSFNTVTPDRIRNRSQLENTTATEQKIYDKKNIQ